MLCVSFKTLTNKKLGLLQLVWQGEWKAVWKAALLLTYLPRFHKSYLQCNFPVEFSGLPQKEGEEGIEQIGESGQAWQTGKERKQNKKELLIRFSRTSCCRCHGTNAHQVSKEKSHDGKPAKILYFRNAKYEPFPWVERELTGREESFLLGKGVCETVTCRHAAERAGNTWRTSEILCQD